MELHYSKNGDYLFPDIGLPEPQPQPIGKYGRLREQYLKYHCPALYAQMVLNGTLWKHLSEIERAAHERVTLLVPAMAEQEGVTEALKTQNQMEWVGRMNNIRSRAEELVLFELVYS